MKTKRTTFYTALASNSLILMDKNCSMSKNRINSKLPKATVQQSLLVSSSPGSMVATGSFFCLGSQTFTVPEK